MFKFQKRDIKIIITALVLVSCCCLCALVPALAILFKDFGGVILRDGSRASTLNKINFEIGVFYGQKGRYPSTTDVKWYKDRVLIGEHEILLSGTNKTVGKDKSDESSTSYCYEGEDTFYRLGFNRELLLGWGNLNTDQQLGNSSTICITPIKLQEDK